MRLLVAFDRALELAPRAMQPAERVVKLGLFGSQSGRAGEPRPRTLELAARERHQARAVERGGIVRRALERRLVAALRGGELAEGGEAPPLCGKRRRIDERGRISLRAAHRGAE